MCRKKNQTNNLPLVVLFLIIIIIITQNCRKFLNWSSVTRQRNLYEICMKFAHKISKLRTPNNALLVSTGAKESHKPNNSAEIELSKLNNFLFLP